MGSQRPECWWGYLKEDMSQRRVVLLAQPETKPRDCRRCLPVARSRLKLSPPGARKMEWGGRGMAAHIRQRGRRGNSCCWIWHLPLRPRDQRGWRCAFSSVSFHGDGSMKSPQACSDAQAVQHSHPRLPAATLTYQGFPRMSFTHIRTREALPSMLT